MNAKNENNLIFFFLLKLYKFEKKLLKISNDRGNGGRQFFDLNFSFSYRDIHYLPPRAFSLGVLGNFLKFYLALKFKTQDGQFAALIT